MFVERIPSRNFLRESKWVNGKAAKSTITKLCQEVIEGIRTLLKGGIAVQSMEDLFGMQSNKLHGHVAARSGSDETVEHGFSDCSEELPPSP